MITVAWGIFFLLAVPSHEYSRYQANIPNGGIIHHPCIANYQWSGVGHRQPKGGGQLNVFGEDFKNAGAKWTLGLCIRDSDGDGKTNGDELGDPGCVWLPGEHPHRTVNITHPGVCEPYNSTLCTNRNSFVDCSSNRFEECEAIKEQDVTKIDLKFNTIPIPAAETTYMCMMFDLPGNDDYHIIANEPIINNSDIVHHMLLFACINSDDLITEPTPCGMSMRSCPLIIGAWGVGLSGDCFAPRAGYRIGLNGYQKVCLQIHYNNPELVSTYFDASGFRLYIQPARHGVQDMATLLTGQTLLQIPPGQKRFEQVGVCPPSCSKMILNKPIYVLAANNHMHYLGSSMTIELIRDGVHVTYITKDDTYNYDSPVTHRHNPPIEIRPGDEIKTSCVYNSMSKDHYVLFGEATSDEMCYGFLSIYPADALNTKEEHGLSVETI